MANCTSYTRTIVDGFGRHWVNNKWQSLSYKHTEEGDPTFEIAPASLRRVRPVYTDQQLVDTVFTAYNHPLALTDAEFAFEACLKDEGDLLPLPTIPRASNLAVAASTEAYAPDQWFQLSLLPPEQPLPGACAAGPREAPVDPSAAEAKAWLAENGVLGEGLSDEKAKRRYLALSGGQYGEEVSETQRRDFLQAMVPIEEQIAAHQSDVGRVTDPKYEYKLVLDKQTPIQQPPIKLQPEQEAWVDDYLDDLLAKDVIAPIESHEQTPIVTAVFLVDQGQSGQPYRLVQNVVPVNKRTNEFQQAMMEARRVKNGLKRYKYASMLDLKAGYFNVPFEHESSYLSTFITHRGKYRWKRLFFGLTQAPAFFTSVVQDVINPKGEEELPCTVYLDDIIIFANSIDELMQLTKTAMQRLAKAGFMLNLRKTQIGMTKGTVLGHLWESGGYFSPVTTKLEALLLLSDDQLAAKSRPKLYGLLSYFRPYIPDFPQRTECLRQLLSKPHLPWTQKHSECVKETVQRVLSAVPIINFDPEDTLRLELHTGPAGLTGILLQKDPRANRWLPVGYHARTWQDTEAQASRIALELQALFETLTKLQHFTAFTNHLEVICSPEVRELVRYFPKNHPKISAQVYNILAFDPHFTSSAPVLPQEFAFDASDDWDLQKPEDELPEALADKLRQPAKLGRGQRFAKGKHVHIAFDGGYRPSTKCKASDSAAGFVIYDGQGQEVMRKGVYMGANKTNNECEAEGLHQAFKALHELRQQGGYDIELPVRVFGDSQLLINFMTGVFKKPKKASLYHSIEGSKRLARLWKRPIAYRHVKRDYNQVADDMVRRSRELAKDITILPNQIPADAPTQAPTEVYTYLDVPAPSSTQLGEVMQPEEVFEANCQAAAVWEERLRGQPCKHCDRLDNEAEMLVCDKCEGCWHSQCNNSQGGAQANMGPWYCVHCRGAITMYGFTDITEDIGLLDYLFSQRLPQQEAEVQRILKLARVYRANGNELQVQVQLSGFPAQWVNIPPVNMRKQIITDTHEGLAHCGRDKLIDALSINYWWPGLRAQVTTELAQCQVCQPDKLPKVPKEPPRLTNTAQWPGRGWSVDLAGPFPRDDNDCLYLAVAVDTLTKWTEAIPIKSKHSYRTAEWLYDLIARWGKPEFIRCDNGTEWKGEFAKVLQEHGIKQCCITVGNSKANGQVERIIRVFKDCIRKHLTKYPTAFWSDILPFALMLLRHTTTRSHGFTPYSLVTGRQPALLSALLQPQGLDTDLNEEQEEQLVMSIADRVMYLQGKAAKTKQLNYQRLVRQYEQEYNDEPLTCYKVGQLVWRREKQVGKIQPKAKGPFRVTKVAGQYGQRITVLDTTQPTAQALTVHASKLALYTGEAPRDIQQLQQQEGRKRARVS